MTASGCGDASHLLLIKRFPLFVSICTVTVSRGWGRGSFSSRSGAELVGKKVSGEACVHYDDCVAAANLSQIFRENKYNFFLKNYTETVLKQS